MGLRSLRLVDGLIFRGIEVDDLKQILVEGEGIMGVAVDTRILEVVFLALFKARYERAHLFDRTHAFGIRAVFFIAHHIFDDVSIDLHPAGESAALDGAVHGRIRAGHPQIAVFVLECEQGRFVVGDGRSRLGATCMREILGMLHVRFGAPGQHGQGGKDGNDDFFHKVYATGSIHLIKEIPFSCIKGKVLFRNTVKTDGALVLPFGHIFVYLYCRYDNLLLPEHGRSFEESQRRREKRICHLSGMESG